MKRNEENRQSECFTSSEAKAQDSASRQELRRLRRLARILDSSIPLPGGYRIGLDGIIGLVPGIGDAIGASLSAYIVIRAAKFGATTLNLLKMMFNVLLETLLGAIPVLGDLFDFVWKANDRNMQILLNQLDREPAPGSARQRLSHASGVLLTAFLVLLVLLIVLAVGLLFALAGALAG